MTPSHQKGASSKMMPEQDELLENMLRHGPSAGSVVLILKKMKGEGRCHEVVQECIRFLGLYPDDVRLRTLLAESYADMGFITLAGTEFEKVAAMIDDMAPAYRSLAEIYAIQQRQAEAADMLRRYLAHYPGQVDALKLLRQMETAPDTEAALPDLKVPAEDLLIAEEEPEDALVDFASPTIAELYYSQGRIDAAIHTYEKVLINNPADGESIRRLDQLKGMVTESPDIEEKPSAAVRSSKKRMMTILERWLPRIRGIRYA
jgi:tetratricopeptide (TPR) repeat protein